MSSKLGDTLGRLVAPPTAKPFEAARLAMVDQLISAQPPGRIPYATWIAAFELGVHGVTDQVVMVAQQGMAGASARSRIPQRRLAGALPDSAYREMLFHRLLSAGIPLERLETGDGDPGVQRNRGVALESAWDEVLEMAQDELARWRGKSLEIQQWRRPTTPLWAGSAIAVAGVITVAAWLGGVVPAPEWFAPIGFAFWGLPLGGG